MPYLQNAGALPKTENKSSLSAMMKKVMEEKKRQEEDNDEEPVAGSDPQPATADIQGKDSDTDDEDYNMMIAGLSEVVGISVWVTDRDMEGERRECEMGEGE